MLIAVVTRHARTKKLIVNYQNISKQHSNKDANVKMEDALQKLVPVINSAENVIKNVSATLVIIPKAMMVMIL